MVVSVSDGTDGTPTTGLTAKSFTIAHLASLNHAAASVRAVKKVTEGPPGFYIGQLKPSDVQPTLPPGHYVFAVAVTAGTKREPHAGQAVATGDLPA